MHKYAMKKSIILVAMATITLHFATAQTTTLKNGVKEKIDKYFTSTLEKGKPTTFDHNKKVAISKIAETRNAVWECWREAVKSIDEEKLPVMSSADAPRDTLYWSLPTHPESNARMPFHYIYKGEKPAEGYPLFLYMHGSGPKKYEWDIGYDICCRFDDAPSAYFIPQIPSERLYRWAVQPQQWAWEKLLRLAFVEENINANRIYFFGISEGGYGSQRLASFYADYLAGAGPMAGGEPLQNAPAENLANIAFSLRTGANDYGFGRNYMTHTVAKQLDSLACIHPKLYNHYVELIPDMGHSIDYRPTTPWLAKFVRNPRPSYFYWEDYAMYDRHREGFYNIRVDETSRENNEQRTCYEINIEDNCINININNVTYTITKSLNGIPMLFDKSYSQASKGRITIFLHEDMVDYEQPVRIIVNGKEHFYGKVKPDIKAMIESCALFFDPERVFSAAVEISVE